MLRFAGVAILATLAGGCLTMEHDLRLKDDGTATYALEYAISEQAVVQLKAMEALKTQLATAADEMPPGPEMDPLLHAFLDPDDLTLRNALKPYADDGITLKSLSVESRAAWRHVDLSLVVTDLEKAARTPFFQNHGFNLTRDKDGHYVLSREPHINQPGEIAEVPTETEQKSLIPILGGFSTTVKVTVPGRILATTAFRTTLSTASWSFDFNRDSGAVHALLRQPFQIVFDSRNATFPSLHYRGSNVTP